MRFVLKGEVMKEFVKEVDTQLLQELGISYRGLGKTIEITGTFAQLLYAGVWGYFGDTLNDGEIEG